MSSIFPLFKLPILCIHSILCSSEIDHLICISTLSRRCYRVIQSLKSTLTGINVYVRIGKTVVTFNRKSEITGLWCLTQWKGVLIEKNLKLFPEKRHFPRLTKENNPQLVVKAGIKHLMELFKLTTVHQFIIIAENLPSTLNVLVVEECELLRIAGTQPIPNRLLADVLYNTKTERVKVGLTEPNFELDPHRLNAKHLNCRNSLWFTGQLLFNLNFSSLIVSQSSVSADETVKFVQRWIDSDTVEFEYMLITNTNNDKNFASWRIFENWQLEPWSEQRRSRFYEADDNLAIDLKPGKDILRKDGLWATICLFSDGMFFGVWHKKFHDVGGCTVVGQVED